MLSPPTDPTLPAPSMTIVEVTELSTNQLHLNGASMAGDREVTVSAASVTEKRMASQLAYLASQHHTSEYNRLKFGPAGAPLMYVPLSIQLPAHVWELRSKQIHNTHKISWWPVEPSLDVGTRDQMDLDVTQNYTQDCSMDSSQQENVMPCALEPVTDELPVNIRKPVPRLNHSPTLNLRRELSMAMSSPLSIITIPQLSPRDTRQQHNLNIHAKTSESHPINISPIVPYDLLPLISSHLIPTPPETAYMFDLPPSLFLNHLAMHASPPPPEATHSYPTIRPLNEGPWTPPNCAGLPASIPMFTNTCHNGAPEHNATLDGCTLNEQAGRDSGSGDPINSHDKGFEITTRPRNARAALSAYPSAAIDSKRSMLLANNLGRSNSTPPSLVPSFASPEIGTPMMTGSASIFEPAHAMSLDLLDNDMGAGNLEKADIASRVHPPVTWAHNQSSPLVPFSPVLGNMLLSSCPGKKVRLNGPIKGRGAICRDLGHDLKRVKSLGVGCVICCLDDEELEFLGAPWLQYLAVARQVGLDVLRIPIPEGLGPVMPAQLDEHLSHIIHSYTLKGVPVLVHCRGGVGRAGLVACCWMLKLGLCGWLPSSVEETYSRARGGHGDEVVKVRQDIIQLVERVVTVVRRRRSVKAIETYEQVRFLVDFVEHLQKGGRGIS